MDQEEFWEGCLDLPNYELSNRGKIRRAFDEVEVQGEKNEKGYLVFRGYLVHRLVAETFIGEIPHGFHVHHRDQDKTNNAVENLQILSLKEHARAPRGSPALLKMHLRGVLYMIKAAQERGYTLEELTDELNLHPHALYEDVLNSLGDFDLVTLNYKFHELLAKFDSQSIRKRMKKKRRK